MNRGAAGLLGLVTVWPLAYMGYFFGTAIAQVSGAEGPDFGLLMVLHLTTMAVVVGLLGIYITLVFRSPRIPDQKKTLWAVVLFFGNMFSMPVFWYLYVWKQ